MKKLLAFTLAETLIVIGIIGVVSALTLPNLNSSTGEKEKVAKVKKIYQNLDDAFGRAQAVYGPLGEWFTNDTTRASIETRFLGRMTEFMKVSKEFKNVTFKHGDTNTTSNVIVLADGTALWVYDYNEGDWVGDNIQISIDIDGIYKGKNEDGRDIFNFRAKGIAPYYIEPDDDGEDEVDFCFDDGYCTSWVLVHGNMDYLKADSNGKCSSGKQLSWTNTTCK